MNILTRSQAAGGGAAAAPGEQAITASGTLSLAQMKGSQINNVSATEVQTDNITAKLQPVAKDMAFNVILGATVAGKYFHLDPDDADQFFPDGGAGLGNGKYLGWAEATKGYAMSFRSFYDSANAKYNWIVSIISGPTVNE